MVVLNNEDGTAMVDDVELEEQDEGEMNFDAEADIELEESNSATLDIDMLADELTLTGD
jgi:hypothetical protein